MSLRLKAFITFHLLSTLVLVSGSFLYSKTPSHPFRKLIGWHLPLHLPRLRLSRFRRFTRFLSPCVTNRPSLLPESYYYIFYFVGTKRLPCIGVVVGFGLALVQSSSPAGSDSNPCVH